MTIYHQKAIELAEEILRSEASKDYADARDEGTDEEFLRLRAEYHDLVNSVTETLRRHCGLDPQSPQVCACPNKTAGGCCKK